MSWSEQMFDEAPLEASAPAPKVIRTPKWANNGAMERAIRLGHKGRLCRGAGCGTWVYFLRTKSGGLACLSVVGKRADGSRIFGMHEDECADPEYTGKHTPALAHHTERSRRAPRIRPQRRHASFF